MVYAQRGAAFRRGAVLRLPAMLGLVGVVVLGLTWRSFTGGDFAKAGGDVLYAVMVLAVVRLVRPRSGVWPAAAVSLVICWLVEFAQLTPWPADLSRHNELARLLLGSTFHGPDLLAYLAGVLLGVLAQLGYRAASSRWRAASSRRRELPAPLAPFG